MKKPIFVMILLLLGVSFMASQAFADMVVSAGTVGTFEGATDLDLDGDFLYTINFTAADDTSVHTINDLDFKRIEDFSGTTLSGSGTLSRSATWGTTPDYGDSADDNALEDVMHAACQGGSATDIYIDLPVTVGQEYKLQLLFSENWSYSPSFYPRYCDIELEGTTMVEDFSAITVMGTRASTETPPTAGAVYTYTFTVTDANLDVNMLAAGYTPAIGALTLETIPEPGTWALLLMGMASLLALRRRSR